MDVNDQEQEHQQSVTEAAPTDLESPMRGIADAERRIAAYAAYQKQLGNDVLNLATAENILLYESLKKTVFDKIRFELNDIRYANPPYGKDDVLRPLTSFLQDSMSENVNYTDIYATTGVSGALECLAFALKKIGVLQDDDWVLMPAPRWQGFKWCFEQRPKLRCTYVQLSDSDPNPFELTLKQAQDAYKNLSPHPRLLVLTNPNNPLGVNYPKNLLEEIYGWALEQNPEMHIISDEIYAHSQIKEAEPKFFSAFDLDVYSKYKERIHVVWGLAKDFGLSGFRVGFIISKSKSVGDIIKGDKDHESMSWFSPLDSLKNVVLRELFKKDSPYPIRLMNEYKVALNKSHDEVLAALKDKETGVSYLDTGKNNSAQFFVLDLRKYLGKVSPNRSSDDPSEEAFFSKIELSENERELFEYIKNEAKVLLLPGKTLQFSNEGFFRMCFTAFKSSEVSGAVKAIGKALRKLDP
ncbi:MAG: aminotransferase class I/II-fold pyridoxal phosphate-dependent enzyme [Pseudonocardiaceae bacterium]